MELENLNFIHKTPSLDHNLNRINTCEVWDFHIDEQVRNFNVLWNVTTCNLIDDTFVSKKRAADFFRVGRTVQSWSYRQHVYSKLSYTYTKLRDPKLRKMLNLTKTRHALTLFCLNPILILCCNLRLCLQSKLFPSVLTMQFTVHFNVFHACYIHRSSYTPD